MLPRFLAAADSALVVEVGDAVSDEVSAVVLSLDARLAATPPAGVVEVIPSLRSLLIEYDPLRTSHARLRGDVERMLQTPLAATAPVADRAPREHVIPVCYDGDAAPDLAAVAAATGLSRDQVVRHHTRPRYRVAMLGNLPGLPYLLGLDPHLQLPRRDDPRDAVPAGSVAIAGQLSCVYPATGPGGWHLIGRTDAVLFDAQRTPAALVAPGDMVRFVAVHGDIAGTATPTPSAPRDVDAPCLAVEEPGLMTTVQDAGRRGHQREGVPVSGALDTELLRIANLLVGNSAGVAALEITHLGPLLRVAADSVRVAVAGDCQAAITDAQGTYRRASPWRSMLLRRGDLLRVGPVVGGLRCILAVEGGIAVEPVLGSRSTYLRGGFGGLRGRVLQRGDLLPLQREYAGLHPDVRIGTDVLRDAGLAPDHDDAVHNVRAVIGPQYAAVEPESLAELFTTTLTISSRSDRVGLRLEGVRLRHRGDAEIISDGCAPGSIQVPGSGQPIVLLADRGTTGGYPKVATVAGVDLPRLGRLRLGRGIQLEEVDVAAAEALRRRREAMLTALAESLDPVPER